MSIETSVEVGYGMIITEEELDHLNSCLFDNQDDDPTLLNEWEDFFDDYIRPIDTYHCDAFFMGVVNDLGIDPGSFKPYTTLPTPDEDDTNTFIKRMSNLQIQKLLKREDLQIYLLHFLY